MHTAYGMSKAALDAFTVNECSRLAKMGIRINNLNPGPVKTFIAERNLPEMSDEKKQDSLDKVFCAGPVKTFIAERNLPEMSDEKKQDSLDKSWDYWNRCTPLGRVAEPSEMTPTLLLLAGDEAGFVTGAKWVIDGGATCFANDMSLYD
uniref:Uncharacterized protein n=1 Tax=Panagrolaimus sp. ES5 TaxID=591445 RepID=A0AC34FK72_9BILA